MWKERLINNHLGVEGIGFYVDDGRVFLHSIRAGWRWFQEASGSASSGKKKTRYRTHQKSDRSKHGKPCRVSEETQEDFPDFWLPALDINIQVDNKNMILYKFY